MADDWVERVRSLLEAPSPAVLATYRKNGSAFVTPVWFRFADGAFEVVIAQGDVKLRHLASDPRCVLVVFEAIPPFRGVEARGVPELVGGDMTSARAAIAGRYLGAERAGASRPSGGRSRAVCSGSSPTTRASGISPESSRPDRAGTVPG